MHNNLQALKGMRHFVYNRCSDQAAFKQAFPLNIHFSRRYVTASLQIVNQAVTLKSNDLELYALAAWVNVRSLHTTDLITTKRVYNTPPYAHHMHCFQIRWLRLETETHDIPVQRRGSIERFAQHVSTRPIPVHRKHNRRHSRDSVLHTQRACIQTEPTFFPPSKRLEISDQTEFTQQVSMNAKWSYSTAVLFASGAAFNVNPPTPGVAAFHCHTSRAEAAHISSLAI